MTLDSELLRRYAETGSEEAFSELVRLHVNLVYSAALRQVNGDDALARDVSQMVFTELARRAASLVNGSSLTGWLYTVTRFSAVKAIRTEHRRAAREQEAQAMYELLDNKASEPDWDIIRTALDEAMHELKESDREAILLRYFENLAMGQVGERLGLSENTARMRVDRAVERLRSFLDRRGIKTSAGLCAALSTHAVQAAPAGLSASLISTSLATAGASGASAFTKLVVMTKLKLAVGTLAIVGLGAVAVLQYQSLDQQRNDNAALRQRIVQLEGATNRPAQPVAIVKNLADDQFQELLRLRGEVSVLRSQTQTTDKLMQENKRLQDFLTSVGIPQKIEADRAELTNSFRQIDAAMAEYSLNNNDARATNFDMIAMEFRNERLRKKLEAQMEFVNLGQRWDAGSEMILFREKKARQLPDGTWERGYFLANGNMPMIKSDDGTFDAWEKDHLVTSKTP